ncbi:hypothetical protein CMI47_18940 [Candidatus Pacearchaeota archaeon]|nr:hypothetical protein [Candidatus Pacearchaeota archaeon]|tara:strand:- start:15872 stop:19981 length:4110 start_codon:yes stop_codon:yes gene_type:complete
MKLGLYGGGFKPFHTGHFSKLLLALSENDKVLSFFGIQRQKLNKKGNPLKTKFRTFGDSDRQYTEPLQDAVFVIYEKALQNKYPNKLDVISAKNTSPINNVHNVLDRFAYSRLSDSETARARGEASQSRNSALAIGNLTTEYDGGNHKIDLSTVDSITVYAGDDEINSYAFLLGMKKRAERGDSIVGEKVYELIDQGKISFKSGMSDVLGLVNLLKDYHPDASEEMITIRGTDVRGFVGSGDIKSFKKYLPDVLSDAEKNEIVKIVTADEERISESSRTPVITDSTILRAASRFIASKSIREAAVTPESHIPGLTEDMNLTFDSLKQLIENVLGGRADHIEEKMDGQNFTFTVLDDGEIRLFGKGPRVTTLEKGGKGREDIRNIQTWGEKTKDAFGSGYDVLNEYIKKLDINKVRELFQNGMVVVEGQILTPINPNTIPYTENHFRFIRPATPYDNVELNSDIYDALFVDDDVEIQDQSGRDWSIGVVPKLEQTNQSAAEIISQINELKGEIDSLLKRFDHPPKTVGEYATLVMKDYLNNYAPDLDSMPDNVKTRAIHRLLDKFHAGSGKFIEKRITSREMDPVHWKTFQKIDKMATTHVVAAIVDLEKIIQKLGYYFFETLEFTLATNDNITTDLANEVNKIQAALKNNAIRVKNVESGEIGDIVDTAWATKLDAAISRVEQMPLFKKAVEGVVLRMPGERGERVSVKLTGMFTPVHRLVTLFRYPSRGEVLSIDYPENDDEELRLSNDEEEALLEAIRMFKNTLSEGGKAFKKSIVDSDGKKKKVVITSQEKLSRDQANRLITSLKKNILDPLDIDLNIEKSETGNSLLGSTGTDADVLGDVDLLAVITDDMISKYVDDVVIMKQARKGKRKDNVIKDTLEAMLNSSQYLQKELVQGVSNIVIAGSMVSIMIRDPDADSSTQPQQNELFQIDLVPERPEHAGDTWWELRGGYQGKVKGVYRNLMLSLLANIAGRSRTTPDENIKVTLQWPGGYTEKINGEEVERIRDPDLYLPLIGLNDVDKFKIESFESLVDYMVKSGDKILQQALDEFEEYLPRYLPSEESEKAIKYVNQSMMSTMSELKVRSIIREAIVKIGDDAFDLSDSQIGSIIRYIRDDLKVDRFTPESGFESFMLRLDDTNAERVREVMKNAIPKNLQVVTMEILSQIHADVNNVLFSATPGERVIVPDELLPLAEYRSTRRGGSQTGAGELIIPFLFNDSSVTVGNASFDVIIGGSNWEVKAAKNTTGIMLGSARGKTFSDSSIYRQLVLLGFNPGELTEVGNKALKDIASNAINKFSIVDDTGDVIENVERFFDELSKEARKTSLNDVEGIVWYHNGALLFTQKEKIYVKAITRGRYIVYEKGTSAN